MKPTLRSVGKHCSNVSSQDHRVWRS